MTPYTTHSHKNSSPHVWLKKNGAKIVEMVSRTVRPRRWRQANVGNRHDQINQYARTWCIPHGIWRPFRSKVKRNGKKPLFPTTEAKRPLRRSSQIQTCFEKKHEIDLGKSARNFWNSSSVKKVNIWNEIIPFTGIIYYNLYWMMST